MEFPEPVISVAVEPKTKADQEKMGIALQKLAQEDPSFRVHTDEESGQTIISGMGELHLEIIVDRMRREFKVEANVGAPQVAYRETIRKTVEQEGKFVRQSGGRGQYGHVWLQDRAAASRARAMNSSTASSAAWCPGNTSRRSTRACRSRCRTACSPAIPLVDVKVTICRRFLPRRRLQRNGLQDRRFHGLQGRRAQGQPGAARADHEGRGGHAGGIHGRCDGRPQPPPRHHPGHG